MWPFKSLLNETTLSSPNPSAKRRRRAGERHEPLSSSNRHSNSNSYNNNDPANAAIPLYQQEYIRLAAYGDPIPTNFTVVVRTSDDPYFDVSTKTKGTLIFLIDWPKYRPIGALVMLFGFVFFAIGFVLGSLQWWLSRKFSCCYGGGKKICLPLPHV